MSDDTDDESMTHADLIDVVVVVVVVVGRFLTTRHESRVKTQSNKSYIGVTPTT